MGMGGTNLQLAMTLKKGRSMLRPFLLGMQKDVSFPRKRESRSTHVCQYAVG
jgi:hypothetical protein